MALMLGLGTVLAGCAAGPQALGITGPGKVSLPAATDNDGRSPAPGAPSPGGGFSTQVVPTPASNGTYFNYN